MKIMLTGATGYLGHAIALQAVSQGHFIHALVRSSSVPTGLADSRIRFFDGHLLDQDSLTAAMQGCDAVIHCAAMAKMWTRQRTLMYQVNVEGTRNILQAALDSGIQKVVVTSSCSVLGPSTGLPVTEATPRMNSMSTDYEISKHLAEELCRQYSRKGLHTIIVSPPAIYGAGTATSSNAISNMISNALRSGVLFQPSPSNLCRNFAFIEDVARGHLQALEHGMNGETYILGGENISYRQFSEAIRKASPRHLKVFPISRFILTAAARLNQFKLAVTKTESNFVPSTVQQVFQHRTFSSQKAVAQLGYKITPFETGIKQTINQLNTQL